MTSLYEVHLLAPSGQRRTLHLQADSPAHAMASAIELSGLGPMAVVITAQTKHSAQKDREIKKEILAFKERMRLLEESQIITEEMLDSIISL